MEIEIFTPTELNTVLRSLRRVAVANERFTRAEKALIEGIAKIHKLELSASDLEPIELAEVARVVVERHKRTRAIQLAIVMALIEGNPSGATEQAVRELANALGLADEGLDVLYEVTHGHAMMARIDTFRRVARFLRNSPEFPGPLKLALPILGIGSGDPALAARYRELGYCKQGSFGWALFRHFVDNDFSFPGEPGGIPMVFHDVGHVLSGYDTDPEGEIQQAAFQAGFVRRDGFAFLLFGILQFHLGLRITPVAKGFRGLLDVPRVLTALHRGASCSVDLSDGFDVFACKNQPLDELRLELCIPPLLAGAADVDSSSAA